VSSGSQGFAVVIDTNVWISGLLTGSGAPAQMTRQVVRTGQAVFSAITFAELKERLWRPKFDRYITLEQRKRFLVDLESIARWVDVPPAIAEKALCRDPADDKFLHAALAAGAGWLVTGDQDLLVLTETALPLGVRILSPADALRLPEFSR
jgi:putative PIN family toxin of toxin-antitoxin system